MTSASASFVGQVQAVSGRQHVGHLGRVVLVHLASVGLDVKLAGHGKCLFKAWRTEYCKAMS